MARRRGETSGVFFDTVLSTMNLLQTAAAEAFVEILTDSGVPVTIGGSECQAMVSPAGLSVDLQEGGFVNDGSMAVRMLVASLPNPAPAHNDTITIGGDRYKIDEITIAPGAGIIEYRAVRR